MGERVKGKKKSTQMPRDSPITASPVSVAPCCQEATDHLFRFQGINPAIPTSSFLRFPFFFPSLCSGWATSSLQAQLSLPSPFRSATSSLEVELSPISVPCSRINSHPLCCYILQVSSVSFDYFIFQHMFRSPNCNISYFHLIHAWLPLLYTSCLFRRSVLNEL